MNAARVFGVVAAMWCAALALPGVGAEPSSAVLPLGEHARVRATEDHAYGHRLQLWRSGNRLLGVLMYWDGNIEGQRGRFVDGVFDPQSGAVRFKATVVRRDVQPNQSSEASFEGVLARGGVSGRLTWSGEAANFRGKNGVEQLSLPWQKQERLASYASVAAWQKENAD